MKMTKFYRTFLIMIYLVTPYLVISQDTENMILDYSKILKAINDISKTSVYLSTPQRVGSGTLFSVPFSDTAKMGASYIATALHILDKRDSIKIIGRYDTVNVYLNLKSKGKESRKYALVGYNKEMDVAILAGVEVKRSFWEYDVISTSLKDIISYNNIKKGMTAIMAGYPFSLGTDNDKLNPVIQMGIIAYCDTIKNLVLVDIPVNPGNSGCPVYTLTNKGEIKLLGIVYEYEPSRQDFVIRKENNKMVPVNTSLGRVALIHPLVSQLYKLKK